MTKYRNKFLREHLDIILDKEFEYSDNFLTNYLNKIPKSFYKYRTCNKDNFDALENDYIWMSTADYFDDQLDSTLNYSLEKQAIEISRTIKEKMPEIVLSSIMKDLTNRSTKIPDMLNLEYIKWIINNFTFSNGNLKAQKFRLYMLSIGESTSNINLIGNHLKKTATGIEVEKNVQETVDKINQINSIIQKYNYIYCLSTTHLNYAMWENYADKMKGFCILYDIKDINVANEDIRKNLIHLTPMIYGLRKQLNLSEILNLTIDKLILNEINPIKEKEIDIDANVQVRTKDPSYSYEQEWRYFIEKKEGIGNIQPFPFAKTIYLGAKIEYDNKIKLLEIAGIKKLEVYQQTLSASGSKYYYQKLETNS